MYNSFQLSQLQKKILKKSYFIFFKSINLNINLFKLNSINDTILLEGLFLLEFFTGLKSFVSYFKKNYKQVNIQIANSINIKHFSYFLTLLRIFYLPILYRRNMRVDKNRIFSNNFNYTVTNVNILTFLPNIYFKWIKPINCFFTFSTDNQKEILLYLYYLGFNFNKK